MQKLVAFVVVLSAITVASNGCQKQETKSPSGDKSLTLTKPSSESITQGGTNKVNVHIARKGFNDPVSVELTGLPEGVTVEEKDMKIAKDVDKSSVNLKASDTAAVGDHQVTVKTTGGGLTAQENFTLTVKKK